MTPTVADPLTEEGALTDSALPRRRRRRLVTGPTMAVLGLVTCALGFYGGVRVEKRHASSSTGAAGRFAAVARTAGTIRPSFAAGAGGLGGGAPGTTGTVASVNGRTLVLTETGGDTVKVKLTSSTSITKTEKVGHRSVHPGDTISVTGSSGKGTVTAASVTDSGDTSTSTSSAGSSGATGSSSSGSSSSGGGVSSLFGS